MHQFLASFSEFTGYEATPGTRFPAWALSAIGLAPLTIDRRERERERERERRERERERERERVRE